MGLSGLNGEIGEGDLLGTNSLAPLSMLPSPGVYCARLSSYHPSDPATANPMPKKGIPMFEVRSDQHTRVTGKGVVTEIKMPFGSMV